MSDPETERPLTRRERRLREMVETGAVPTVPVGDAVPSEPAAANDEIEISPVDEQGRVRSRREIRQLREQALAELESAGGAPETRPAAAEPAPRPAAAQPASPSPAAPPQLDATQPFSLDDLREAEQPVPPRAETPASGDPRPTPEAPAAAPATAAYSLPRHHPLDDQVSVFDDPSVRTVPEQPGASDPAADGDFDELISRAVAQESATTTTNSSALILPSLPETGDLTGPLGGTGELFITGSISLPKSMGETGGHVPLREPLEHEQDLEFDPIPASGDPILPVSATRAVSAVSTPGNVVAKQSKEKSKLPIVLIVTGGALVLAVAALLVWGVSSGLFG